MVVFEVNVENHDPLTPNVGSASSADLLEPFFASHLAWVAELEQEPPSKKRRIAEKEDKPQPEINQRDCVVLADLTLRFRTDERTTLESRDGSLDSAAAVPVTISADKHGSGRDSPRLAVCIEAGRKRSHLILTFTHSDDSSEAAKHFHWCTRLSNCLRYRSTSHSGPSFYECELWRPSVTSETYELRLKIKWKTGSYSGTRRAPREVPEALLTAYFPEGTAVRTPWAPQDFYENVHVPDRNIAVSPLHNNTMISDLYPFQKRAVIWLLQREGVHVDKAGMVSTIQCDLKTQISLPGTPATPPCSLAKPCTPSFHRTVDAHGRTCYISHLATEILTSLEAVTNTEPVLNGGILAEEMGLGKTVELIMLIALHKRPKLYGLNKVHDHYTDTEVVPSSATLIITPPTILEQWMSELQKHAPSLKIFHYEGVKRVTSTANAQSGKLTDDELKQLLLDQDVVLTTYAVLASEIHYADQKPERNFRYKKVYEARRSPLVQISWWRVCLDEAQMIESGVSNSAKVAKLIPRCNAWCVTGTPLKKDVNDLLGLLIFLRYEPFCRTEIWRRLLTDYKHIFKQIFGQIALRHTKSSVREELRIPPQRRVVLTIPFTAIEEQNYSQLFQQMCDDCGLDRDGAPLQDSWNPDATATVEKMRSWLTRLRQTCLHAEIGARNRRALGRGDGPLRTVKEVLEVLIDQNETSLRAEERIVLMAKVMRGHLLSFGKEKQQALNVYLEALEEATAGVQECRRQLAQEQRNVQNSEAAGVPTKVEGSEGSDTEDNVTEEKTGRVNIHKQRLRAALELEHLCAFFTATAYFQIKDKMIAPQVESEKPSAEFMILEKKESDMYDRAKAVRRELLAEVAQTSTRLIEKVSYVRQKSVVQFASIEAPQNQVRGIESRKMFDSVEDLTGILNAQAQQLRDLRSKLMELLTVKLLDQDEDVDLTGEEYELSTTQQDEQYAYFEGLRAAHADRHCMITGQINILINHEMSQALKTAVNGSRDDPEAKGVAPALTTSILMAREAMRRELQQLSENLNLPPDTSVSVRGIMAEIRSIVTGLQWQEDGRSNRAAVEVAILEQEQRRLQQISSEEMKALAASEKELELYRSTMNARLSFYKSLQQLSDMVAPLQEEETDAVDTVRLEREQRKENSHNDKLSVYKTKRRYLEHLQLESSGDEEQRICVICQNTFEIGVLTVCGHQYCKECICYWWSSKGTCPTCKRVLKVRDFHEITYKPQNLQAKEEQTSLFPDTSSPSSSQHSSAESIYSSVPVSTLDEIKTIDLQSRSSFGTKIDTIARHLIWLRSHDPGSKSIIFSQYRDFLQVLSSALSSFKIGHTSIGTKNGIARFREHPATECFLMHAKADSAGLTLVNATHVFLCEPLINAAIELQAIARVHRIGQRRPTTVWMYLVSDTVEEAIYDISVSRRLAHIRRSGSKASTTTVSSTQSRVATLGLGQLAENELEAANSMELQKATLSTLLASGQSGGEMVEKDDLWSCLFGKPRSCAERVLDGAAGERLPSSCGQTLRSAGE